MIRKAILFGLLLACSEVGFAQVSFDKLLPKGDSLALEMDFMRVRTEKRAMTVLGSWAAVNIIGSLAMQNQTTGVTRQFYFMNGFWNLVNGGLALNGFLKTRNARPSSDAIEALSRYHSLNRTLLFNCGLDLAYITTGLYLQERGRNELNLLNKERFTGFGQSLVLQGGFLLAFDALFYLSLQHQSSYFKKVMQIVWLRNSSAGITLRF